MHACVYACVCIRVCVRACVCVCVGKRGGGVGGVGSLGRRRLYAMYTVCSLCAGQAARVVPCGGFSISYSSPLLGVLPFFIGRFASFLLLSPCTSPSTGHVAACSCSPAHRRKTWRAQAANSQLSLPQLKEFDWRIDIKTSADTVTRMSVPTALVQMKVRRRAGPSAPRLLQRLCGACLPARRTVLCGQSLYRRASSV